MDNSEAEVGSSSSSKKQLVNNEPDEGNLCLICNKKWTDSGIHRVCSLACGDLFGLNCIEKYFESQTNSETATLCCPACKSTSNGTKDIRFIYMNKLMAVDTAKLAAMNNKLANIIKPSSMNLVDFRKYLFNDKINFKENNDLETKLQNLQSVKLFRDASVQMNCNNSCRVFDVSWYHNGIVTSMRSPISNYTFGIKKVNILTYNTSDYIPLHSKQICDISIHPKEDCFLTVSKDTTFKITNYRTGYVMHTVPHSPIPLSACCWHVTDQNVLYIGNQSGQVLKYDARYLCRPVTKMPIQPIAGDASPVVSIASIPRGRGVNRETILTCKTESMCVYEHILNDYKKHSLSLNGPLTSMMYQKETGHLLVSSRPNNDEEHLRYTVYSLKKNEDQFNCTVMKKICGGRQKFISRPCFVKHKQDHVAAYNELSKSVYLWNVSTGYKVGSVSAIKPTFDLKGMQNQYGNFLLLLNDDTLEFFRFDLN